MFFVKPKIVTKFTKRVVSIEQSRHSTTFCNRTRNVPIGIPFYFFLFTQFSIRNIDKSLVADVLYLQGPLQKEPCIEDREERLKPYCNRTGGVFWYHFSEINFSYKMQTKIYTNSGLKLKKKCPENIVGI